jgi:carbon-monoxide dehydrogenase small subunit
MIVSAKALLEEHPDPDPAAVRHWMEGNICRCTGYQTIVEAVLDAADHLRGPS